MGLDYKSAGVNKEAGYQQVQLIKDMMKATYTDQVMTETGGFSGMVELGAPDMKAPVLVSGTDGVGTKLMVAQEVGIHDTVGIDLVAMCVNDIICQGAKPLFFLDYIATGKLVPEKMASIVQGVADGCKQAGAALIGGETAEMPGMYGEDDYDLAGFAVGLVDKEKIISGKDIKAGDIAIALPSSGVHSNGFSLVRAILEKNKIDFNDQYRDTNKTVGEVLLTPTKIYAKDVLALVNAMTVKGLAHITGGGLFENVPRTLPEGLGLTVNRDQIPTLDIFDYLQDLGQVAEDEMFGTFNMGIGMVIFLDPADVDAALQVLAANDSGAFKLGQVTTQADGVSFV
ncbi:Phosphoribosylformylglycinamidine cyclo-ligase [Aerococcus viridans]|uniref:Phosphoribosylformylglycinamidine cyclo-ligase n=2 Tax=Aerococcus viridans TaxID=1377 RepID=A0AAU8U5H1_9LACT|nr:phosphoribosylformylglycinamidine cyclo-ligase [Aerococcus viridans]AMC01288.1 phosphoribosylaminoimidazole synthetase [Aerococcus viridans]EFG50168.1 phosphoribosylformylglycinamidine cyclo-ligase [Aerococcus viridans ATCC 11563 = CCUG 4311]SUU16307.1 Phosphoribosylformylglycinamidine cyclo-ligase [Aerococcus viridans]